jgi:hypothetical protein
LVACSRIYMAWSSVRRPSRKKWSLRMRTFGFDAPNSSVAKNSASDRRWVAGCGTWLRGSEILKFPREWQSYRLDWPVARVGRHRLHRVVGCCFNTPIQCVVTFFFGLQRTAAERRPIQYFRSRFNSSRLHPKWACFGPRDKDPLIHAGIALEAKLLNTNHFSLGAKAPWTATYVFPR